MRAIAQILNLSIGNSTSLVFGVTSCMFLDRPKAMAVAETRIVEWNGNKPCLKVN